MALPFLPTVQPLIDSATAIINATAPPPHETCPSSVRRLTAHAERPIRVDDIRWALEPLPLLEHIDPLTLTDLELFCHVKALRRELRSVRALARAGVQRIHYLTNDLQTARHACDRLRDEYRRLSEQILQPGAPA